MRLQVRPPSPVQRTQHATRATVEDMRVDLRRRHVFVPEQLLDGSDIRTALQQVGGKAVPQRMRRDGFGEAACACSPAHRLLQHAGIQVVSFLLPVQRIARTSRRRKRSEEHTSELQSRENLVCRLLLEKKKNER